MGMFDFIKSLINKSSPLNSIEWQFDQQEFDVIYPKQAIGNPENFAKSNPLFALQLGYIKSLEQNIPIHPNANGVSIPIELIPDLGEDFRVLFQLPPYFPGVYKSIIQGYTKQASFNVQLELHMPDGSIVSHYTLAGCFLKLSSEEIYSLSPVEYNAIKALHHHQELSSSERNEFENNYIIFQLQLAQKAGMKVDLAHFQSEKIEIIQPESVGVAVNILENGNIELLPAISGVNAIDIKTRLPQLNGDNRRVLRVKDKFVIFTEDRLKAINEIFPIDHKSGKRNIRIIERSQIENFLRNPTAYLDGAIVNLDTGFSLRVFGAEKFIHKYFGDIEKSGIDWFGENNYFIEGPTVLSVLINSEYDLQEARNLIDNARKSGADIIHWDGRDIDISDVDFTNEILSKIQKRISSGAEVVDLPEPENDIIKSETEKTVVSIKDNDEESLFERHINLFKQNINDKFELSNLKRSPYPHQEEGIHWILSHIIAAQQQNTESGALLADDMGLGKTYMTLVSIEEYYRRCELEHKIKKPIIVIAPLSLLENWKTEIDETFNQSPFNDVIILQEKELKRFKVGGSEIKQNLSGKDSIDLDNIRYSLKIGKEYADQRLDMPGRLILATYQTLRDYQFSLCRIDWGIAIFDEAQNLKNPNALATRAAKGLKAEFKLLATGTPVENSLKDFWCLIDTAAPGLLGSWQEFRKNYIQPILSAGEHDSEIKLQIGQELRERVGSFMLRRTKTEKLKGLPEKIVYSGFKGDENYLPILDATMSGEQLKKYNNIIENVKNSVLEDQRELILSSLRQLKITSVHPDLLSIDHNILEKAKLSSKINSLFLILERIKERDEKALIFSESKIIQSYLVALLMVKFGIQVEIINGETAAIETNKNSRTRKSIIDDFQNRDGFGVLIMSPIAAGVGLTIVGANNVIHLERHWNPAKEAQATDRVYRIGQKRTVNVYLPMATHPDMQSFDIQLHNLLNNKINLSNAVIAPSHIDSNSLAGLLSLN